MLISWVLTLKPTRPATVSPNLGRAAHAWFLEQVNRADPAMNEALHSGHGQRPFTVSNLFGISWRERGAVTLSPEREYALRVTSFSPELSHLLTEQVIPDVPEALSLADAPLAVTGSTADPAVHAWAGVESFEGLVQRHTLGSRPPRRVSLKFASPTLFRSQDKNFPLPLPGLVFGGLLDKWNEFASIEVHPDVRRFADECLAISRYRLETQPVSFGPDGKRGVMAGFLGSCSYAILVKDKYWMGLINLLAAFGLYAGVGLRTTMGLGQTRMLTRK